MYLFLLLPRLSPRWPAHRRARANGGGASLGGTMSPIPLLTGWRPRLAPHPRPVSVTCPTRSGEVWDRSDALMATALTNPELFWALREGGGNLAAVTSIEIDLLLVSEIYGAAAPFLDTVGIASHDRDRDHQCRPRGPDAG